MAQIALTSIGQTLGSTLLPNGIGAFGVTLSGAAIGGAVGGIAGAAIDGAIFGRTREGPRIESVRIMESREGAGIPNVYGRMRVGGQVIWAARLKETRQTERVGGGKGGPRVANYTYSASFAVALCDGPINRVSRVWANGEVIALTDFVHRVYTGTDDQQADPLIEAIEGAGCVPAYRGTAYIVFEDMPLEAFGNRLPQLSFEVFREPPPRPETTELSARLDGVNIIPASGEFVYGTTPVQQHYFPAIETPENVHIASGVTDMFASLDQLESDLPSVHRTALTVGWFGNDLRAGACEIRPGVETRDKETRPYVWEVGGVDRGDAWLISTGDTGGPNYGGTPADRAVIEGIRELVNRGFDVTMSPFLFMDIPIGNALPDPYGGSEQAQLPWRGRITASNGTASARDEINAFLGLAQISDFEHDGDVIHWDGDDDDWGFRRFILHHAFLASAAGGVESFLIGSEMVGLTRIRDDLGAFPFVDGLIALVADVRAILGPDVKISYAADWTEYGAYVPGDGSNDVLFPLDPLWADSNVDFVGIDWYPPTGDWRAGQDHLDAQAGFKGADDPDYLLSQITGGEAFDYFYASSDDRDAQIRTPIIDTAHGENWVFRQKDLLGWWNATHHERPGGARASVSTAWQPASKPIRLSEIGFPAVDKGGNSPNLFFDPKSSESALPPYSTGERDDLFQRRALDAAIGYWQSQTAVEATYVWAWDARPWPVFPLREDIWSDGANWTFGHWLNGRAGLSELGRVIEDIARHGGVEIDASAVTGVIDGYALSGVSSVRDALAPLFSAYDLMMIERGGKLVVEHAQTAPIHDINKYAVREEGVSKTRTLLDKPPGALRLTYIDGADTYSPATINVFDPEGDRAMVLDVRLPIIMTETRAQAVAEQVLARSAEAEGAVAAIGSEGSGLEPGDRVVFDHLDGVWRIVDLIDNGAVEFRLEQDRTTTGPPQRFVESVPTIDLTPLPAPPQIIIVDGPALPGRGDVASGPLVAAFGTPWSRPVDVLAGPSADLMTTRAVLPDAAGVGRLVAALATGPLGVWDQGSVLEIEIPGEGLPSHSKLSVLNGSGLMLIESDEDWELLAYQEAELVALDSYRLRTLLRGLNGSEISAAPMGARCLLVDARLEEVLFDQNEAGLELLWQAIGRGGAGDQVSFAFENKKGLSYAPGHLRRSIIAGIDQLSWVRRAAEIGDAWRDEAWPNTGRFRVDLKRNGETIYVEEVDAPMWEIADQSEPGDLVEVREIGHDGRFGKKAITTL
ncbi:MAG: glycoside hydrolase/phage tail family protein [Pseudomonadota bacterium]